MKQRWWCWVLALSLGLSLWGTGEASAADPQIGLRINKAGVGVKGKITVEFNITAGTTNNTVDYYVLGLGPDIPVSFLTPRNKFVDTPVAFKSSWRVRSKKGTLYTYNELKGTEPEGPYSLCAILVQPGKSVFDPENWISFSTTYFVFDASRPDPHGSKAARFLKPLQPLDGNSRARVAALHRKGSSTYDLDCMRCHGEMTKDETSLSPSVPGVHQRMVPVINQLQGTQKTTNATCIRCHQDVDLSQSSAAHLRRDTPMKSCAPCHGPGSNFPFYRE